jgi:hypothetical protein
MNILTKNETLTVITFTQSLKKISLPTCLVNSPNDEPFLLLNEKQNTKSGDFA